MALEAAVIAFNTGTGAIGTTISLAPGFEAKAILAFLTGRVGTIDSVGRATSHKGVGFAVSPSSRASAAAIDTDAAASTICKVGLRDDAFITAVDAAGSAGRLDLDSISATMFDLIVDEVFPLDYRVLLWVLGGSTITSTSIVQYTTPAVIGNQAVTGVGFVPSVYFTLGVQEDAALPIFRNGSQITFGAAVSVTERATLSSGSEDGKATSKTRHYALDIEDFGGMRKNTSINEQADHVSMDADGFTEDWLAVAAGDLNKVFALAIEGGDWAVRPVLTEADTVTPIVVAGLASTPSGGLILTGADVENVAGSSAAPNRWSAGAWASPGSRGAHSLLSEDALGSTKVSTALESNAVLARILSGATLQGVMDIQSRDPLGATFIMTQADSAPHFSFGIFAGPFVAPPAPPPVPGGPVRRVPFFMRGYQPFSGFAHQVWYWGWGAP